MKHILITAALVLGMNSHAYSEDLDGLLKKIEADISAQRLAVPAGNNALERIETFRTQAPFDFRITPLILKLGESYVALANKAIDKKQYDKAQGYLDTTWKVASLTPGLESTQEKLDKLSSGKKSTATAAPAGPSAAELKEQKALALAAVAEKKRLDAERQAANKAEEAAKKAAIAKAAADKKAQEERERQRRLAASQQEKQTEQQKLAAKKAAQEKAAQEKKLAAAKAEKARLEALAAKKAAAEKAAAAKKAEKKSAPVKAAVVAKPEAVAPEVKTEEVAVNTGSDSSEALATYPLSQDKIVNRDRSIREDLVPMCKAILDNDASIVLHTKTKSDYRWLTVRLTLCTRRLDRGFRLRHSHEITDSTEPFMSLHPARNSALVDDLI